MWGERKGSLDFVVPAPYPEAFNPVQIREAGGGGGGLVWGDMI
jgi:hypothetical protein